MRINHSLKLLIVIVFIVCAQHAIAQSETEQTPKLEIKQLREKLYVIYGGNGQGSNVGLLLGDTSLLLIDAMVAESGEKLLREIRAISKLPVQHLINTHDDFDHSGGNAFFANHGANIIVHRNAALEGDYDKILFSDQLTLHFNESTIRLFHEISHNPSDTLVALEKENVIFMGDTFTTNWYPTFFNGGLKGQLRVIDRVLALANEDSIIVPGHGEVSNTQALKAYRQNSIDWTEAIMRHHTRGSSIADIASNPEVQAISNRFKDAAPERLPLMIERIIDVETSLKSQQ